MDKQKLLTFAGQFLLVGAATMTALWAYDYLNKPSVAAPATTPATTTTTATATS